MERKYGVPRAIILAQAILEGDAGRSELSSKYNNHFGIKCFRKGCEEGHCVRYEDDTPKDRFRCYGSARESFESHAMLLTGKRYGSLLRHGNDYEAWAAGLKKKGYATDSAYKIKLTRLVRDYKLDK